MRLIGFAAVAALTIAATAYAQGPAPGPAPSPGPQPTVPDLKGPDDRVTDFLRMRDEVEKRKAGPTDSKRPVPIHPDDVVAGSEVRDSKGVVLGSIQSVGSGFAVIASPAGKIEIEFDSLAKNNRGLLINMPKSRFDAILSGKS